MKLSKKAIRIMAIALLASLLLLIGKYFLFPSEQPAYLTVPVTHMDIEDVVLASGMIKPIKEVSVGAQVNGQIKSLKVKLGERVKKGQLLAEIDPVIPKNALLKAEAAWANVQAQKQAKQAFLKLHEAALKRQQVMMASDATTRADFENAQAQVDSTRADIVALETQIKQAIIDVDIAKANLSYTRIVAPMDGEVINIAAEEGQTLVSAQSSPTILVIADLDTMTVKAKVSEADVARVKSGDAVYFTILGMPDKRFASTLRAVEPAPELSSSSVTASSAVAVYYNGLFDIPNSEHLLKPAMTAQVSLVLKKVEKVLAIPVTALGKKKAQGQYEVRVLDKNAQPQTRLIHTGLNNHIHVQIIKGLQAGEKVILVDPSQLQRDSTEDDQSGVSITSS